MIRVHQLGKCFKIFGRPVDRLWDWVAPARWHRGQPFWALRDVTFDVPKGTSLGIIGVNGAGKSTLLKILTGTTNPTQGSYEIGGGRVSSLLELGTGFHPEFTGRQNIQFNGKMVGLSDEELAARYDAIVEFAELGRFIDQPVRTYSSGMALRLGFALASSVDPDVLIIDEALAVGDMHFQQKCLRRIREFHERGVTVLFVSHDPSMVKRFCTEAILLDGGRLLDRGRPDQVLDYYTALLAEKYRAGGAQATILRPGEASARPEGDEEGTLDDAELGENGGNTLNGAPAPAAGKVLAWNAPRLEPAGHRTGNFRAVITSAWMRALGAHGNSRILVTGTPGTLVVRWVALEPVQSATVGIMLKDRLGQEVFGINTAYRDCPLGPFEAGEVCEVRFKMPLDLGEGLYSICCAVHTGENHTELCYDWVEQALEIQVLPNPDERFTGIARLRCEIDARAGAAGAEELAFAQASRQAMTGRGAGRNAQAITG